MNKIGIGLIEHYLKESNYATLGWKSKENKDGVVRTARNIAGSELYQYGNGALEHYIAEGKKSKVYPKTITLLRASIVPQIIVGDVMNFIDLLDIDDVDNTPDYDKDFKGMWEAEVFNHEEHDEVDELIEDLDKLTAFCIAFLHDGAYGGESQGREVIGDDLEEEKVNQLICQHEEEIANPIEDAARSLALTANHCRPVIPLLTLNSRNKHKANVTRTSTTKGRLG